MAEAAKKCRKLYDNRAFIERFNFIFDIFEAVSGVLRCDNSFWRNNGQGFDER
ncbi:hypothetical protein IZU99_03020 [Oscillospiraceae bacterium CM]|nr:hypothetical protein IZU99_03020 [Oscillospiraceae bacterium CM]